MTLNLRPYLPVLSGISTKNQDNNISELRNFDGISPIPGHDSFLVEEYLYHGRLRGRDCAELVLLHPGDDLSMVAKADFTRDFTMKNDGDLANHGERIGISPFGWTEFSGCLTAKQQTLVI